MLTTTLSVRTLFADAKRIPYLPAWTGPASTEVFSFPNRIPNFSLTKIGIVLLATDVCFAVPTEDSL